MKEHDLEIYFVDIDTVSDDIELLVQKLEYLSIKDLFIAIELLDKKMNTVFDKYDFTDTLVEKYDKTFREMLGLKKK